MIPYDFDFGALREYLGLFISGSIMTVKLSVLVLIISMPLGLGGALLRTSRFRVLALAATAYVEILRNIPIIIVLYVFFYNLASVGVQLDSFASALAALSVNSTAYVIEIFRGGLAAIPKGQYEAAHALGFRPFQVFGYVVLPQLVRVSFPSLGNQVVGVVLGSSLASVVGVFELTASSYYVGSITYRFFEVFVVAGTLYIIAVQIINRVWIFIGGRLVGGTATSPR